MSNNQCVTCQKPRDLLGFCGCDRNVQIMERRREAAAKTYDLMPYLSLPFGVPCSELGGRYVFCRIRPNRSFSEFSVFLVGREYGVTEHLNALTDMAKIAEPRFYEIPAD